MTCVFSFQKNILQHDQSTHSARIIATFMDPELVSVGGVLSTRDTMSIWVNGIVSSSPTIVSLDEHNE